MQKSLQTGFGIAAVALSTGTFGIEPDKVLMFQKGPVVLKPQFQISETYNDNITFRHRDKRADLISTISPGIEIQVGRKERNIIDFTYFFDRLQYLDNTFFNANQHRIGLRTRFQKRHFTLDGNDSFEFMSSPIGGGYSASSTDQVEGFSGLAGSKIDRATFFDLYRLTWNFSERTDLYLQGIHSFLDYEDGLPLFDSRTITGTLGYEYSPLAKTSFFGETYYGQTENSANAQRGQDYPTANFIGIFIGVRGQFSERLKGTAKAGYEHRFYSDDGKDLNAPVVELTLEYQFTERTLVTAGYSRRQYESVQFVRTPYTTDSISLGWQQQIGGDGRLRSAVRAGYITSNSDETAQLPNARTDNIITGSLTLSYDIKLWMRAFGSYTFEHLNSDERSVVDYNVNRFTLGLQIGY